MLASAGEGDGQDAHGKRLIRGVDYVPDSFDASEKTRTTALRSNQLVAKHGSAASNYVPDSIDASEDNDNGR